MENELTTKCGRARNNRNKKFNSMLDLDNHERDCPICNNEFLLSSDPYLPLTDSIVSDDESDGVYFAIAYEMGEIF